MSSLIICNEERNKDFAFDHELIFDYDNQTDVDNYISGSFLHDLKKMDFDILYIEVSLSENILDYYGFILAFHIRLSKELEEKRYVPIIFISDMSIYELNKIDFKGVAKILFTNHIYLVKDNLEDISNIRSQIACTKSFEDNFDRYFMEKVEVKSPIDYLSHHSFANEWSIYKWAEYFNLTNSDSVNITKDKILSLLYFKYITNKYPAKKISKISITEQKEKIEPTKILYIDDEWDKGWKDIFETFFCTFFPIPAYNIILNTSKIDKSHSSQELIIKFIGQEIINIDPDIVILDIRLHPNDFTSNRLLNEFTGIKIFEKIIEINPGIQCIVFTASNNSLILEKLYVNNKSILGYIRKITPENQTATTEENIEKLVNKTREALDRVYLKELFTLKCKIKEKLNANLFHKHIPSSDQNKISLDILKNETEYIFNTLNSNLDNKLNYAVLSITRSLEAIKQVFIEPTDTTTFRDETPVNNYKRLEDIILSIITQKMNYKDVKDIQEGLESLLLYRNNYMHSGRKFEQINSSQLIQWFRLLDNILWIITISKSNFVSNSKSKSFSNSKSNSSISKKNSGLIIVKKANKN